MPLRKSFDLSNNYPFYRAASQWDRFIFQSNHFVKIKVEVNDPSLSSLIDMKYLPVGNPKVGIVRTSLCSIGVPVYICFPAMVYKRTLKWPCVIAGGTIAKMRFFAIVILILLLVGLLMLGLNIVPVLSAFVKIVPPSPTATNWLLP